MIIDLKEKLNQLWESKYKALVRLKSYNAEFTCNFTSHSESINGELHRPINTYTDAREIIIHRFNLAQLGVGQILVSQYVSTSLGFQGVGIGKLMNEFRCEAAASLKLPIIATVNNTNIPEIKTLLANNWKRLRGVDEKSSLWMYGGHV